MGETKMCTCQGMWSCRIRDQQFIKKII